MKKKTIIGAFSLLIVITAIVCIIAVIDSYNYDMDPNNGVDILEGLGVVLIAVVGGFVVFYELDLFYTVYFFTKPKTIVKSILNVVSNLCLLTIFFSDGIARFLYTHFNMFDEDWILPIVLFLTYVALRIIGAMISICKDNKRS